ncbi:Flp pilus assembly protein CpaB [Trinickia terrae]|uniref:Flp pilus assembly protein CpaB n=1 Tax=Trinickia terrae TaxID=2571161 RepID=A0A4U1HX15_9BURK|nr:Flp pilus assembly protein CpaB [Trinickia terrae]TKC86259.1 Flp pilus assembly protein CpaB [Trinickia terrae]
MSNIVRIAALVVVALIGALVLRTLFVAAAAPRPSAPPQLVRVPYAAADLPAGLLLRESDLAWRNVEADKVPKGALVDTPDQSGSSRLKGALLRENLPAGAPLVTTAVTQADAPDFLAAALKPGLRAVSVAIDEVSGNAGLIQPGDYVDVLLTQQLKAAADVPVAPEQSVESETVVRRVRVLAIGSAFQRQKPASEPAATNPSARTVTLEVSPRTAQVVSVATHLGTLSLALRSFATSDRDQPAAGGELGPDTPPVWAGDVSRGLRAIAQQNTSAAAGAAGGAKIAHPVVVYRGSVASGDTPAANGATGTPGLPPLPATPPPAAAPAIAATGTPAAVH